MKNSLVNIENHGIETERLIGENNALGEALQAANTLIDIMLKRPLRLRTLIGWRAN